MEKDGKREGLKGREGAKGRWGGNGMRKRMDGEGAKEVEKEGLIVVKSRRLWNTLGKWISAHRQIAWKFGWTCNHPVESRVKKL